MGTALLVGCFWVLASTVVAFLPLRFQYVPGVLLLIAAPVILAQIGMQNGWALALLFGLGVLSMFRNPLRHYWARLRAAVR